MDSSLKAMFKIFQGVFGDGFWKNTVIEFSRWPFDVRSVSVRETEGTTCKSHEDLVNKFFMKELGVTNRIPCVFVDACYEDDNPEECEAFARETEKMLQLIKTFPEYECKDFEKVMAENDELRKKIKGLEEVLMEAEKIAEISLKEKQTAEKKTLEAEKRIEASELEHARITQELSEVERQAKLKLEKCEQEMENCRREAKRRNKKAEKAIAEAEEKRRQSERLHQEEILKKKLEYKSLMEKRAMEEQLQRQRAEMNEKLRQAEARAEKAKHEAQLAQIRKDQAERERNRATEEAGNLPCRFCCSTTYNMLQLARQEEAAISREREAQNLSRTSYDKCNCSDCMHRDVTGAVGGISFSSLAVRSGAITSNGSHIGDFSLRGYNMSG